MVATRLVQTSHAVCTAGSSASSKSESGNYDREVFIAIQHIELIEFICKAEECGGRSCTLL
jgi:hypothetical protein